MSSNIAVLLYGCETWRTTKRDEVKDVAKDILGDEGY